MKLYELTYLIPFDLPEDGVKSFQEKVNSFIADQQGTLDRIEDITKKGMVTLNFYMNPEKLNELDKKLRSENQIVHYMILNKKPAKAEVRRRVRRIIPEIAEGVAKTTEKSKKVEIKEIEKKLEEILGE